MSADFARVRGFLSARDAWWSARRSEARGSTRGRTPTLGAAGLKEGRWKLAGKSYLRAYTLPTGALVRFPAELLDAVAEQISAIAPKLAAAYDQELGALVEAAWDGWPTDTGLSKSLLDVELEQRGEVLVGRVVSRAPYTVFIRDSAGYAYQRLLRAPGRGAAARIASAMEDRSDGG